MKFFFSALITLASAIYCCGISQTDSLESIPDIISEIAGESAGDTENESEAYIEEFEDLLKNPVDLNSADVFELHRLPMVNISTANKIIDYRKRTGHIFSKSELINVKGLDENIIRAISPFVTTVENNNNESKSLSVKLNLRTRILQSIQNKAGFNDKVFMGTPLKNYNRFQLTLNNYAGFNYLTDKDEGEIKINDFSSFNIWLKDLLFIKYFVAGDYSLEFGQGLSMWGSSTISKGNDAITPVFRQYIGIKPKTGALESGFLRGCAITLNYFDFYITGFFSRKYFDATLDSSSCFITSIKTDGFHRTKLETEKLNNSLQTTYGLSINIYKNNFLRTGMLINQTSFNKKIFTINRILKDRFINYSIYYDLYLKIIEIAGETAYDGKFFAHTGSLQFFVTENISSVLSFRYYMPYYKTFFGSSYGESSRTQNEAGFYSGIYLKTSAGRFSFYFNIWKQVVALSANPFPLIGREIKLDWSSPLIFDSHFNFKLNYLVTEQFIYSSNMKRTSDQHKNKLMIEFKKTIKNISLKSVLNYIRIHTYFINSKEDGVMFYQDFKYSPFPFAELYYRIIFFRTFSFNTALYEYENDLEGLFKSSVLYGSGYRWYIILKIKTLNFASITLKYSETYKPQEKFLGSGLTMINGSLDNQVSLQFDFRL